MKQNRWLFVLWTVVALSMVLASCTPAATPAPAAAEPTKASAAAEPTQAPAAAEATTAPAATEPTAAPAALNAPEKGGTLRVAYTAEIDTLNALTSQNLTDIELTMVEGLIVSNDKNEYIPVLAKEIPTVENGGVKILDDGQVEMTWKLQEGVKWHDGVEFTADDVCFTYDFIVGEKSEVYNRDQYLPIKSCKVVDKYTVVMTWEKAYAYYNSLFEAILPKHVLEGKDVVTFDGYNRSPLGTGPFKFVEWKSGEYVKVERNPDYWRGTDYPYLDGIVFTFIPDDNTRLNAMKAKEHDLGQITPTQVKEVQGLEGYKVNLVDQNSWNHFDFSVKTENGKALFSDVKVRQAIAYAIDRKAIAEDLMEGTVKVADSPVQTNSPYFNPDTPVYTFDPEKSKSLLDEAGWKPGSDGIREKDGVKFSFTIMNRGGRVDRIAIAQVIQAQLKDVGIDVKMETKESAAWTKQWRSGEWEAVVGGWMLPADPSVTNQYACKGSNNMTGLCSEELDKLMYASDQELDFAKRKPLIDQVQVKLAEEMLSLPIYYNVVPEVVSEKLGNFKGSGTNLGSFWNVYEWYLAK